MSQREVTENDFRAPEFVGAQTKDYEFRADGQLVRKDRWERGIRSIAIALDIEPRGGFEISEILDAVDALVEFKANNL